jgi:hypothetical protein
VKEFLEIIKSEVMIDKGSIVKYDYWMIASIIFCS